MATNQDLKAANKANIRDKSAAASVTRKVIADGLDAGLDYTDQQLRALQQMLVSGDDLTEALQELEAPIEAAQQAATQAQTQATDLAERVDKLENVPAKTAPVVGDNLLDTSAVTRGKFRHQANGAVYDDDRFYIMATPATPGQSYPHTLLEAYTWFYDADGNGLAKALAAGGPAPAGTVTLGGTGLVGNVATDMLMYGVAVPASYQPFWKLLVAGGGTKKLPLEDKKGLLVGDSQTAQNIDGNGYHIQLKKVLRAAFLRSLGFNGQTTAGILAGLQAAGPDAFTGVDHTHVHPGINDAHHGDHPIGQPGDAATAGTLCGDIRAFIQYLRSVKPGMTFSFSTPTEFGKYGNGPVDCNTPPNEKGPTLPLVRAAMLAVCLQEGVPCVDTYLTSGITLGNISFTTLDNLHPAYGSGADMLGAAIGQGLNQLLAA